MDLLFKDRSPCHLEALVNTYKKDREACSIMVSFKYDYFS